MKLIVAFVFLTVFCTNIQASHQDFGMRICHNPGYSCLKIKKKNSWSQLFPNEKQRELVKRINRTNEFLSPGMVLAVPNSLDSISMLNVSPFELTKANTKEKIIVVSLDLLAWAAYAENGKQVYWGPISAGSLRCESSENGCTTPTGTFRIFRKKDKDCFSNSFPETIYGEKGGAYMPYCMFFYKGFALHGSDSLPGYNASHGCIRLFIDDARWLNENFIDTQNPIRGIVGTKVVIS